MPIPIGPLNARSVHYAITPSDAGKTPITQISEKMREIVSRGVGCLREVGGILYAASPIGVNNEKHWMDRDEIDDGHT
jgi:hypothetical protein